MARYNKIGIHIDAPEEMLEGPEEDLTPAPAPRPAEAAADELSLGAGDSGDALDL
jgi:hypothetical protein